MASLARMYAPTHANTALCTHWPKFSLVNFNEIQDHGDGISRKAGGMSDLPAANATVVAQLFADELQSRETVSKLMVLKNEIWNELHLRVNIVFLNFWMPLSCTKTTCDSSSSDKCQGWVGGCDPNSPALKKDNWQGLVESLHPELPMFQVSRSKIVRISHLLSHR